MVLVYKTAADFRLYLCINSQNWNSGMKESESSRFLMYTKDLFFEFGLSSKKRASEKVGNIISFRKVFWKAVHKITLPQQYKNIECLHLKRIYEAPLVARPGIKDSKVKHAKGLQSVITDNQQQGLSDFKVSLITHLVGRCS